MNTQQAYINGFVKRASEYGYSREQALGILKTSGIGDYLNRAIAPLKDSLQSAGYNASVDALQEGAGLPHHVADYGMKTLNSEDISKGINNLFTNKYNSDVFAQEHPLLNSASSFLKEHNIDPTTAAMAAGGAGLLGGGYLLGKHLHNKKQQQSAYQPEE